MLGEYFLIPLNLNNVLIYFYYFYMIIIENPNVVNLEDCQNINLLSKIIDFQHFFNETVLIDIFKTFSQYFSIKIHFLFPFKFL